MDKNQQTDMLAQIGTTVGKMQEIKADLDAVIGPKSDAEAKALAELDVAMDTLDRLGRDLETVLKMPDGSYEEAVKKGKTSRKRKSKKTE